MSSRSLGGLVFVAEGTGFGLPSGTRFALGTALAGTRWVADGLADRALAFTCAGATGLGRRRHLRWAGVARGTGCQRLTPLTGLRRYAGCGAHAGALRSR